MFLKKINFTLIGKVFLTAASFVVFLFVMITIYVMGYTRGVSYTKGEYEAYLSRLVSVKEMVRDTTPSPTAKPDSNISSKRVSWGGPDLWEVVNKRRVEMGVNPLSSSRSDLCTIASIRLNELLETGKLDGHEGFSNLAQRRPDLKWIFDSYNISEFLVQGADTPSEAVSLWENTLGHKQLLTGGEYVWGCIYAQNSIAVAIAAYQ